jgi:hypothetical protein
MVFERQDPQKYVLLYARVGAGGVLLGTQHFKPSGTEYATEKEIMDLGYVPVIWKEIAFFAINHFNQRVPASTMERFMEVMLKRFGKSCINEDFWDCLDRELHRDDDVSADERGVAVEKVE